MCFERTIREKKVHHNNWCTQHKQFCPDARNGECVAKWCQYDVYDRMCVGCPREKHCHEEMDFCDAYLDAVEGDSVANYVDVRRLKKELSPFGDGKLHGKNTDAVYTQSFIYNTIDRLCEEKPYLHDYNDLPD